MLRHVWSVICSKSVIDNDSNNISLFDVIEEVRIELRKEVTPDITSHGAISFNFEWVTLWARAEFGKPTKGQVRDCVLDPSGKVIGEREYEVDLSKHERFRIRRMLQNPLFQVSGQYQFCTQVKGEKQGIWNDVSSVPLTVFVEKKETKQS